jgi:hypothetical protein
VNGDGIKDLALSFQNYNYVYVIFGNASIHLETRFYTNSLNGTNGFTISSSLYKIGSGIAGNLDINKDGIGDFAFGFNPMGSP